MSNTVNDQSPDSSRGRLAKDCIDIGLQTNQREPMLAFWGDVVGLPFEELLKVGGGTHQLRHGLNGAVFKLNHVRDPLPDNGKTGYTELLVAREGLSSPRRLTDPDGNRVSLVPPGYRGITTAGIGMRVRSLARFRQFYCDVLGLDVIDDSTLRWGSTVLMLEEDPAHVPCIAMPGLGYRYITVQVWDVDAEHARVIEGGGAEGRAPATLGTTARISFVTDPDGNWIEISQRASLTGPLPGT